MDMHSTTPVSKTLAERDGRNVVVTDDQYLAMTRGITTLNKCYLTTNIFHGCQHVEQSSWHIEHRCDLRGQPNKLCGDVSKTVLILTLPGKCHECDPSHTPRIEKRTVEKSGSDEYQRSKTVPWETVPRPLEFLVIPDQFIPRSPPGNTKSTGRTNDKLSEVASARASTATVKHRANRLTTSVDTSGNLDEDYDDHIPGRLGNFPGSKFTSRVNTNTRKGKRVLEQSSEGEDYPVAKTAKITRKAKRGRKSTKPSEQDHRATDMGAAVAGNTVTTYNMEDAITNTNERARETAAVAGVTGATDVNREVDIAGLTVADPAAPSLDNALTLGVKTASEAISPRGKVAAEALSMISTASTTGRSMRSQARVEATAKAARLAAEKAEASAAGIEDEPEVPNTSTAATPVGTGSAQARARDPNYYHTPTVPPGGQHLHRLQTTPGTMVTHHGIEGGVVYAGFGGPVFPPLRIGCKITIRDGQYMRSCSKQGFSKAPCPDSLFGISPTLIYEPEREVQAGQVEAKSKVQIGQVWDTSCLIHNAKPVSDLDKDDVQLQKMLVMHKKGYHDEKKPTKRGGNKGRGATGSAKTASAS